MRVIKILMVIVFSATSLFAQTEQQTQKRVEDILGVSVKASNFMVIKNGGEIAFNITSNSWKGIISFSQDYLTNNPESAKRELLLILTSTVDKNYKI